MCHLLMDAIRRVEVQLISDIQRIAGAYEEEGWLPDSAQALMRNLLQ